MPDVDPEERRRTEKLWLRKLHHAEERYHLAHTQSQEVQADYRSRPSHSAEEESELREALKWERTAEAEYIRVLRAFTALILHGELPSEGINDKTA